MYILFTISGIIFLLLDLVKSSTIKLSFASSFLFSAIVAYKYPQMYLIQTFCLVGFSIVSYILISTILKKEQKDILKLKSLDEYLGEKALVTKDIGKTLSIDGLGQIKYKGYLWSAKSIDDKEIKAGSSVEIVSKENMIMNVKVITNASK